MDKEELLLDLTHKIIYSLSNNISFNSIENKQFLVNILDSMNFFVEQGNYDRAILEGKLFLNKLNEDIT